MESAKAKRESFRSEDEDPEQCGVGLRITDTPPFRVRELVTGGSAMKCGRIRIGDTLISVDGVEVSSCPISKVRSFISGSAGSLVRMKFRRLKTKRKSRSNMLPELIPDISLYASISAVPLPDCPSFAVPDLSISFEGSSELSDDCFAVHLVRQRIQGAGASSPVGRRSPSTTQNSSPLETDLQRWCLHCFCTAVHNRN